VDTLEPADPEAGQKLGLAFVGIILLFFSLSGYGQLVATGVVEEKQSRVVELLLASIKPWQLLAGKIIGLGAVGLLQLVILSVISGAGATAAGLLTVPTAAVGMFVMVVVWYLLGFFLFAALYAAVGSTVSRQEELNSVVAPMIFLLLIPFVLTLNLLPNDPRNGLAAVLSFIPFFSQTVMPARYALGVASLGEVLVAAVLALIAIVVVVRLAGRVYQNSVLRTGARVSLREALSNRS
jgi:ABC-2 type transport system permease protein